MDTFTKSGTLKKVDGESVIKLEPGNDLIVKTKGRQFNDSSIVNIPTEIITHNKPIKKSRHKKEDDEKFYNDSVDVDEIVEPSKIKLKKIPDVNSIINEVKNLKPIHLHPEPQIEPHKETNFKPYLSKWLGFNKPIKMSDDSSIGSEFEANYINKMFDEIDKHYSKDDVLEYEKYFTDAMMNYILKFVEKKDHANHGIEYSDFVMLVVYPQLVKNVKSNGDWDNIDKVKLMLIANELATEERFKHIIEPINRYRVIRTLYLRPDKTMVRPDLKRRLPEFYKIYDDFMRESNGLKIKK
jgi:hypothetical protein